MVENLIPPCVVAFHPPVNPVLSFHSFGFPPVTISENFLASEQKENLTYFMQ